MPYTGGKGRAFQKLISLMPPRNIFIAMHLGGGALLLRKRPARRKIGIDRDSAVIDRWRTLGLAGLERSGAARVHEDPADLLKHLDEVGGRR